MHDLERADSHVEEDVTPVVWDQDVRRVLERLDLRSATLYRPQRPSARRGFIALAVAVPMGSLLLGILVGWLIAAL